VSCFLNSSNEHGLFVLVSLSLVLSFYLPFCISSTESLFDIEDGRFRRCYIFISIVIQDMIHLHSCFSGFLELTLRFYSLHISLYLVRDLFA
jgi:hypothetical protein